MESVFLSITLVLGGDSAVSVCLSALLTPLCWLCLSLSLTAAPTWLLELHREACRLSFLSQTLISCFLSRFTEKPAGVLVGVALTLKLGGLEPPGHGCWGSLCRLCILCSPSVRLLH